MATLTEHYGLRKPGQEDYYNIGEMNGNMDAIDGALAQNAAQTDGISEKLGTPSNAGETIFGLLEKGQGLRVVKSIQRVIYDPEKDPNVAKINEVEVERCIVLFERLRDAGSSTSSIGYTLKRDCMEFTQFGATYSAKLLYGFWIVELY